MKYSTFYVNYDVPFPFAFWLKIFAVPGIRNHCIHAMIAMKRCIVAWYCYVPHPARGVEFGHGCCDTSTGFAGVFGMARTSF